MTFSIPACTIPDCPREGELCRHERRAALLVAPPFEEWADRQVGASTVRELLGDEPPS